MHREKQELDRLLTVLDGLFDRQFSTTGELVREISKVSDTLPLPRNDVHPHFHYIDALEEKLGRKSERPRKSDRFQFEAVTQNGNLVQLHTKPGSRD